MKNRMEVAHWVKHGDQRCEECVRGMRAYMHERAERRKNKAKEKA